MKRWAAQGTRLLGMPRAQRDDAEAFLVRSSGPVQLDEAPSAVGLNDLFSIFPKFQKVDFSKRETRVLDEQENMVEEAWHWRHDHFNLVVLPCIITTNCLYLFYDSEWYSIQFWVFFSYLVADVLWLIIWPRSVATPTTIVIHHVLCMIGWSIPRVCDSALTQWICPALLVEINTWLLIARRNWKDMPLLSVLFYATWAIFRLGLYPYYLFTFGNLQVKKICGEGSTIAEIILLLLMISLNAMNFMWTLDILRKSSKGAKGL